MKSLNEILTLDHSCLIVINLNKYGFKRLNMLQLNVKCSNTFLNLKFLGFIKFTFAHIVNNIFILHISILVNSC